MDLRGINHMGSDMKPGLKSTEFYIVAAILSTWVSTRFGIDLSSVLNDPDDISSIIKSAQTQGGDAPVWLAVTYVITRFALKWKQ